MTVKFEPFRFDEDAILGIEIKDRVDYYISLADEALSIAKTNKTEAMAILRELKDNLDDEYRYYSYVKFDRAFQNFKGNNHHVVYDYTHHIKKARAKIIHSNNYSYLLSNLYDISDYISMIEIDEINDQELYGQR
ncbi:TPA: hypothetical protein U1C40_000936 [Streptococcus suis]|nr:hypothetical protein [Streptococcus suis]